MQARHWLAMATCVLLCACSRVPQEAPPGTAASPAPVAGTAAAVLQAKPIEASAETGAQAEDWSLPGAITARTTIKELEARFGSGNVRKEHLTGVEGIEYDAWILFPDDPAKRLELVLDDGPGPRTISQIRLDNPATVWHDANGLHPGMPLSEVVRRNGGPVEFSGLDWDYGGTVTDWLGGKLAPAADAATLSTPILTRRDGLPDAVDTPSGDAPFRSDDKRWPDIGHDLVIGELLLAWPSDEDE